MFANFDTHSSHKFIVMLNLANFHAPNSGQIVDMWEKMSLYRDDERHLILRKRLCRLLIFSPEPRSNRFFDVGESLSLIFALRYAAG
jgi:hypothetical protein